MEGFSGLLDFNLGRMAHVQKSRELMNASPPQENDYAIFGWGRMARIAEWFSCAWGFIELLFLLD
jgi:hypothetical protein